MARRRTAALALAALTLALLAGCASAHRVPTWQPAGNAAGAGGGLGGPVSTSPSGAPSPSPSTASPTPAPEQTRPTRSRSAPPAPPAGQATGHGPYGSISTTGSSSVAMTFDDGPGPYTSQVLDLLEKYGIHATFCIIGRQVASYPDQIKRMVADGDTLCNHTWDHDEQLRTRTPAQITTELQKTSDAIHAIVPDAHIPYFRNPGGNFSPQTISIARSMGMKSLFWSVDPQDWRRPGTDAIISNVMGHTRPGSIVLMHDGGGDRSQSVAALRTILPNFKGRFTLVAMPA